MEDLAVVRYPPQSCRKAAPSCRKAVPQLTLKAAIDMALALPQLHETCPESNRPRVKQAQSQQLARKAGPAWCVRLRTWRASASLVMTVHTQHARVPLGVVVTPVVCHHLRSLVRLPKQRVTRAAVDVSTSVRFSTAQTTYRVLYGLEQLSTCTSARSLQTCCTGYASRSTNTPTDIFLCQCLALCTLSPVCQCADPSYMSTDIVRSLQTRCTGSARRSTTGGGKSSWSCPRCWTGSPSTTS